MHLGKCEKYGCGEDAVGCTDDGDLFCEDHLFFWSFEQAEESWGFDDDLETFEDEEGFPDSEVELLDTALFDGEC